MICWYCHWGWPKIVREIYDRYNEQLTNSELDFGPGHIVWSDENFEDDSIDWCIRYGESGEAVDLNQHDLAIHLSALRELRQVPEEIRDCCPEDYDGEHPENYPPPVAIEWHARGHRNVSVI